MTHSQTSASPIRLVIITGLSGSGKSTALHALEDLGYFCIDNLPIVLLPRLLELGAHTTEDVSRLALVVDAREGDLLGETPSVISAAREQGHQVQVVFLDASDPTLLRRYSETRRRHPLAEAGSIEEGIAAERMRLVDLRQLADQVVDTSHLNVHELKATVQDRFKGTPTQTNLSVTFLSFGFKHGLPPQADLLFDCRFLPNPYFEEHLRAKTGMDSDVAEYVLDRTESRDFLARVSGLLEWLLPLYQRERKAHLTVAMGCTGGRHRSVALTESLAKEFLGVAEETPISVRHRDMAK